MIIYYVGWDIHKKTLSYCIKTMDGRIVREGTIEATRPALRAWLAQIDKPWAGAMEATLFTGWVYDFLKPHAAELKVAHPKMLKAIAASKKKNDRVDAGKIADLLRCNLLPECHMLDEETRELRRVLRYRNLLVRQAVLMKNKMAGLLMEVGAEYNKRRLYGKKYFEDFLGSVEDVPKSVVWLLKMSRSNLDVFHGAQKQLLQALKEHRSLRERVDRLMTIAGIGEVTALTWALEIGDAGRFRSRREMISYCGLCSAQRESAGKSARGPISKDRNKHLQTVLIEAAKLAPRWNAQLAALHARELARGNRNRATICVARKLAVYLLAVDRRASAFMNKECKPEVA